MCRLLGVSIIAALSGFGVAGAQTVEDYLKQVHDADPEKRVAALTRLKTFPANDAVVAALLEALKDKSDGPRLTAAYLLGQFGTDPYRVVPALMDALDDQNSIVRGVAAFALGGFGKEAGPALAKLGSLMADPDLDVRRGAIQGLSGFAASSIEAQALIAGRLQDPAPYVRSRAVNALSHLGDMSRNYLPQFIAALADGSDQVREEATQAIGALGAAGAPAFPAMIAASRNPDYRYPFFLKYAIRDIAAKQSVSPVPLLIAALNDPENSVDGRAFAAETLGEIGPGARAAEPDLLKASQDGPARVRSAAAEALAKVNPAGLAATSLAEWIAMLGSADNFAWNRAGDQLVKAGARAVPLLLDLLRKEGAPDRARVGALFALGHIGKPAQVAMPILTEIAASADSAGVRNAALTALGEIGQALPNAQNGPALEALSRALGNPKLRANAALTLGNWGPKAAAAVPAIQAALERSLDDKSTDQQSIVHLLTALGQAGTRAPEAVSQVTPLLEHPDMGVSEAAALALSGMPVSEAVAALTKALHDPRDWMRGTVVDAIGRMLYSPDGRAFMDQVLPALLEHAKDPAVKVRVAVAGALASSASPAAVRCVIDAMSDSSGEVRWHAAFALGGMVQRPGDAWIREAALPALISGLDDSEPQVALFSAVGLKAFGPAGAPALPALRRAVARADPNTASTVADVIKTIEAKPEP